MIYILHISDLHFVKNAAAYNTEEILLREAAKKVEKMPQGKKLLIVTGDFHNFWDKDYQKAEEFLKQLTLQMGLDIKQDVFVIPGNHDVGNDTALEPLLSAEDRNWKSHQESCLEMLKKGKTSYIKERLQKFRPYSLFVQNLGVYDSVLGVDFPASSHVRSWRNKLNILHLNTALIADGSPEKDNQMADVDNAANPMTWDSYYDTKIPSIAIGHNSFYDINESQRHDLVGTFTLRNVSAYLCGDRHQIERNPEYRKITIQPEQKHDIEIPNLVAAKSIADGDDNYSEVGFCWHCWDEESDEVSVEFRKWTKYSGGKTEQDGEGRKYDMRHDFSGKKRATDKSDEVLAISGFSILKRIENNDTSLQKYLLEVLKQKRKSHPSFQLLEVDEIDSRLYPNIKEYKRIEPWGRTSANSIGLTGDSCPIWETIRDTWSAPEHRSIVILGDGGIGKTVALFSIADALEGTIPVPALYIPMYELVDKDGQLLELDEYIAKRYRRYSDSIDTLATATWDDAPKVLILLDGFNEISFSLRRRALDVINEWHDSHPGAQIIAVSRPMDGLNLVQELAGDPLPIELTPLKEDTVRAYLQEVHRRIPAKEATIWEDLQYPLFLNLYVKSRGLTKNLPAGYPLSIKNADNGGALIWNFLQRELLRHRADKNEKAENWVLRCAVANEYFLPNIAYRMVSEHRIEISYKLADKWIKEALNQFDEKKLPKHLKKIWDKYEMNHGQVPKVDMFSSGIWRDTVLRDSGILIPHVEKRIESSDMSSNYVFMHQHFRDCLAGLYLINQAETANDSKLPKVWKHSQSHLTLNYAAELMDSSTAKKLWEINRMQMQYDSSTYVKDHSGTFALLELHRRRRPIPQNLDFSGMDIRGVSLARYMACREDILPLFQEPRYTRDTKLDRSTFQNEGHFSAIDHIEVLPDGRIVSSSYDGSLRVWDPSDGRCLQSLKGHPKGVSCVTVLPDGRIVSGSIDCSLRIWDPLDGRCLQILEGHSIGVSCVTVLPDGRIVSGSIDHTLRVWDPSDGRCLQVLNGHSRGISCVAILPDGKIVSGSTDRSLRIWDSSNGRCLQILEGHFGEVRCVAVLTNGKIVSGSIDRSLRVWDPSDGRCLLTLEGHVKGINCVASLSNGRIVSGSTDRSLRVWNSLNGRCLQTLKGHSSWITCVTVLADDRIVSGSYDGSLRVWDSSDGRCLQPLKGHVKGINCVASLPDGRIVSGSTDHSLRVWDSSDGRCLQAMERHSESVTCVAVLTDGRIVSGSDDGTLRVWDSSDGRCLQTLERHSGWVNCVTVLPDGRIVSGSADRSLRVWNSSDGRCLHTLEGHSKEVSCVAVLPDGRIVSGSDDGALRVWDLSNMQCLQTLKGHSGGVRRVVALPDGRIVSGSYGGSLHVWNSSVERCIQTLEWHSNWVSCIAACPDGRIVSGSYGGLLRVWDPSDGRCLQTLKGHSILVTCVAVLPDGRIVSGSTDRSLRVWDPSDGRCLQILEGHSEGVRCVAVIPDGRIVSGSTDGLIKIWDPDTGECKETIEKSEINVSHMNLSNAILTRDIAKLLWQNGATISRAAFEKYIHKPC